MVRLMYWILLLPAWAAQGQSGCVSAGGDGKAGSGSLAYSIAQVAYVPINQPMGSVYPGLQQPFEIQELTGIHATLQTRLRIYPNPASERLVIETDALPEGQLIAELVHMSGQMLLTQALDTQQTGLEIWHLPPGSYFLKVYNSKQEFKTFKIVKQ